METINFSELAYQLNTLVEKAYKFDQIPDYKKAMKPVNSVSFDLSCLESIVKEAKKLKAENVVFLESGEMYVEIEKYRRCHCGCGIDLLQIVKKPLPESVYGCRPTFEHISVNQ